MSAAGGTALRVELARETAAADLERFVRALGLNAVTARHHGRDRRDAGRHRRGGDDVAGGVARAARSSRALREDADTEATVRLGRGDAMMAKSITADEARAIGEEIGIDWTNVTDEDPLLTGKIALAHLNEFADYHTRLAKMEADAEATDA
jgi:hypothetical protein